MNGQVITIGFMVVALVGIAYIIMYNGLKKLFIGTQSAWSDIDIQLKRRNDLIPNLVNTVKGYAKYEQGTLNKVTELRSAMDTALNASDVDRQQVNKLNNQLHGQVTQLLAVAENYPDLKASESYLNLQRQLVDTEDKISSARRFYNIGAGNLNGKVATFPWNIVAKIHGIHAVDFYKAELTDTEREPTKVEF